MGDSLGWIFRKRGWRVRFEEVDFYAKGTERIEGRIYNGQTRRVKKGKQRCTRKRRGEIDGKCKGNGKGITNLIC